MRSITPGQGAPEEQTTSEWDLGCLYLSQKCRTACRVEPDLEIAEESFSFLKAMLKTMESVMILLLQLQC